MRVAAERPFRREVLTRASAPSDGECRLPRHGYSYSPMLLPLPTVWRDRALPLRSAAMSRARCKVPPMLVRIFALAAICHGALAGAASQVAPGIHLIEGEATPNRQPDGNSIVIAAPKGLIVFDTGRHREHAQEILDFARAQDRPIAAIVNSHWHLDHVGGNPLLRAAFPG